MLLSNVETPALILDLDLFEGNRRIMKEFTDAMNLKLRPHYKTHKCTAIAHMQMQDGAKGICCAKVSEAADLVAAGIEDVLIANQITDPVKIAKVAALADCCHITVCVDDAQNVRNLSAAAALQDSVVYCLVEYDIGMKRCGVHTFEEVYDLAKQISDAPHLVFEGIQAYAGTLAHQRDDNVRKERSEAIEEDLIKLKRYLEERGLAVKEISGVSTGTVFFRPKDSIYTEIQAGSYVFMDASYGAMNLGFRSALFVLTSVISRSGGKVITDAGMKSVGVDQWAPFCEEYPDKEMGFSEEHGRMAGDGLDCRVGDKLRIVPGHCCTTINLHDAITFVRKGKVVDRVPITSRGKSL